MATISMKQITEYPLPACSQTHEVAAIGPDLLLVSQQPSGVLVKLRTALPSGRPLRAVAHVIDSPYHGLHGLTVSQRHAGALWVTQQFSSQLLLLDPVAADLDAAPRVLRRIPLPAPARGPHVVAEDGDILWTSCKDSHHIVRVDGHGRSQLIPCPPRPIFVQLHPRSGDVYATLDQSSALFRVPAGGGEPGVIAIAPQHGATPVGMVPGPDGNLWFALLGGASGGNGAFGRILDNGQVEYFQLSKGPAASAGYIHLGFGPERRLYLLASSMASHASMDGVVELGLSEDYSRVESQQTLALPSQHSMTHRVLSTPHGLYVTQLGACSLAHLRTASSPYAEGLNELADPYALWGCGVPLEHISYPAPDQEPA
jgi:streptogramin lyase